MYSRTGFDTFEHIGLTYMVIGSRIEWLDLMMHKCAILAQARSCIKFVLPPPRPWGDPALGDDDRYRDV